jgi:transposase-like protein
VESGQSIAAAARNLGVVDQTLFNWVKAHREGKLAEERPLELTEAPKEFLAIHPDPDG